AANFLVPVGRVSFGSRFVESMFYGALVFSPVLCAGLLFRSSFKRSESTAGDFGANIFGAMVGGVGEYTSLVAGYRFLLVLASGRMAFIATVLTLLPLAAPSPTRFVTSKDGTRIAYDVTGAGPALILLHGGGGNRRDWHEAGYVVRLSSAFTVIAIDQRGS